MLRPIKMLDWINLSVYVERKGSLGLGIWVFTTESSYEKMKCDYGVGEAITEMVEGEQN